MENNAKAKTSDAIQKLFELQADEATLLSMSLYMFAYILLTFSVRPANQ
jgi:hypothetical protein